MKKLILLLLTALVFTGCLTTNLYERQNEESIIIGKLNLMLRDAKNSQGIALKGDFEENIRISVKHMKTGKFYSIFTDKKGYFTISDPMKGDYVIESLTITDKSLASTPVNMYPVTIPFAVDSDASVYSLNTLDIKIDKQGDVLIGQNESLNSFKSIFEADFVNSDWLQTEWIFVPLIEY